jgi:hypothetical protein
MMSVCIGPLRAFAGCLGLAARVNGCLRQAG